MQWRQGARRALARVLMAIALMPAFAYGQATPANGCFSSAGANAVRLEIPPAVTFDLDRQLINGEWLYRSRVYEFNYRCVRNRAGLAQVGLRTLADFSLIRRALRDTGVRLDLIINGDVNRFWNPDPFIPGGSEDYFFGDPYAEDTGERTFTVSMLLIVDRQVTSPLRVFMPSSTAFKLVNDPWGVADPGIFITTSSTRFQYVPRCIGELAVDSVVPFDTVLNTATYNGKLPQAKPFQVITRVNPACPNLDPLIRPEGANANDVFHLPLAVSFEPQGGERMDSMQQTVFLKNADGKENGLKLRITNAAGNNVQFGALFVDRLGMPISLSVNNIATPLLNTTSVTQAYTAHLEREPAIGLSMGKYNTQVLVKASWY
ncbi:hypothetical protein ACOTJF_13225 [Achromobacter ruhlandii]|uniref:hypothetical protein n=1 Tax=Achromobacter ruhlandii TaxID=72557 RepID=UPI003B9BAE37